MVLRNRLSGVDELAERDGPEDPSYESIMNLDESAKIPSDGELIAAVMAGERDRFTTIVERYQHALLRLASNRLGRHDWAEDVVQETFLCAFRWLHTYDSRYSFRTWLWTIALNQCHRHFEKRSRQAVLHGAQAASPVHELVCPATLPEEVVLADEQAAHLAALLSELPAQEADALRLRFFGGLKFQEIADALGCSLTSAKNWVRFGLVKLGTRLGKNRRDSGQAARAPEPSGRDGGSRVDDVRAWGEVS